MIREIVIKPQNKYGKYFLSLEAPGDENQTKSNTKVINVKPNNRKRLDFTAGSEQDVEDNDMSEETPDDNDYTADDGDTTDDTTDYTGGAEIDAEGNVVTPSGTGEEAPTQEPTEAPADGGGVDIDAEGNVITPTEDTTTNEETPTEAPADGGGAEIDAEGNVVTPSDADTGDTPDDGTETTDDTGAEVDTGEDTDYTDDGTGDTTTDDTGATDDTTSTGGTDTNTEKKGPGLEYDSTRKYMLFENFISLNNAIDNYISKLENIISDDYENNRIVKTSINKLREIQELCESYMTMKFEVSGYIQSLLFYQNLIVMVQLVFDGFNKIRKNTNRYLKH